MLDAFGLINMNGGMYDPVIGRILSPDKYVQSPGYTQSYNRYSYCFNNPLKYTDPSGWIAPECDGPVFVWLGGGFGPGPRGGGGPGSGNHWSDGVRDEWGNFMLMSAGTFTGIYGQNEYDKIYNAVTGNAYTITDREAIKAFMQALKEQSEKARQQAEDQKHGDEIANGYPGGGMSCSPEIKCSGIYSIGNLLYHSSVSYIYDGHRYSTDRIFMIEAGQHVRIKITNMNILLGVQLDLQDVTSYTYKKGIFGIPKQVFTGDNYSMVILPGQSQSFDFYRFDDSPQNWWFQIGTTVSDAAIVRLDFYSSWVPSRKP